jgi:hypothetical protein
LPATHTVPYPFATYNWHHHFMVSAHNSLAGGIFLCYSFSFFLFHHSQ